MNLTETILALAGTGGLSGMAAWIGKGYATKRAHDSKDHALDASTVGTTLATMVRLLEREQDAHAYTRTHLGDRLSAANTEIDLRGAQVGDLAARVETLTERFEEMRVAMRELRQERDEAREENERLEHRIAVLEGRITPDGTPRPPMRPTQHESVGGHE